MYLHDQKIIFVHIPKTAGNNIQTQLLPYTKDQLVLRKHRDGADRFEVEGEFTLNKNATVDHYRRVMGDELFDQCSVMACVRRPVDRALSMYHSMSEWMRSNMIDSVKRFLGVEMGHKSYSHMTPQFKISKFEKLVHRMQTMAQYLYGREPDILLRHETFTQDIARAFLELGIAVDRSRPVNVSRVDWSGLRHNPQIREVVARADADDFDLFGNEP